MRTSLAFVFVALSWSTVSAQEITFQKTYTIDQQPLKCREVRERIRPTQPSFCSLTGIGGRFAGGGEGGRITLRRGRWEFRGTSCQPGVKFEVTCIAMQSAAPENSDVYTGRGRRRGAVARLSEELQSLRADYAKLVRQLRNIGSNPRDR